MGCKALSTVLSAYLVDMIDVYPEGYAGNTPKQSPLSFVARLPHPTVLTELFDYSVSTYSLSPCLRQKHKSEGVKAYINIPDARIIFFCRR